MFRKTLVVIQFALSIFMLISTLIVFDQLTYLRNKDLGFDKQQVLRLELSGRELQNKAPVLVEKLKQNTSVVNVGLADASPGQGIGKLLMQVEDAEGKMVERGVDLFSADYDFVKALGMTIVQGRDFSRDIASDTSNAILVNEAMVKRMGWKDPIGRRFTFGGGPNPEKQVIGVIKDYHQNSLYDAIEPLMIVLNTTPNLVFIRMQSGEPSQLLASLESTWKEVNPNHPFEYQFLDQDFDSQYRADEKRSQIFTAFSGLTILIACLGLLGLSAFTTEQRTKEIGVRKILGSSVQSLVMLVSKEFFILVGIGMVLAFPVAWYFTDRWLQNFAYRIELINEWPTFLMASVLAFIITMVTVGYYVIKASVANPVKALREE